MPLDHRVGFAHQKEGPREGARSTRGGSEALPQGRSSRAQMRERTGSVWGGADDSGVDGQVVQMTREWTLIGVPSSAGAHHAGQERAPAALRKAGLPERLRRAGLSLDDAGD